MDRSELNNGIICERTVTTAKKQSAMKCKAFERDGM
jgi:hypothetical protein